MSNEIILRMMGDILAEIRKRSFAFEFDPDEERILPTLRRMINAMAEDSDAADAYKMYLIRKYSLADYEVKLLFEKEPEPNQGSPLSVLCEWVSRCWMPVPESDEDSARNHELTRDEVTWLLKNGEFAKGSIEVVEVQKDIPY